MKPLCIAMHELPLEGTGGGVLLRELLRYWALNRPTVAVYPVYPHQREKAERLAKELESERVKVIAVPVTTDWGKRSFTVRRLLSAKPGCVVAFQHKAARAMVDALDRREPEATWLLVSPFAAALLPNGVPRERVLVYYTNVDEDIVMPSGPGFYRRIEAAVERRRVRRYVRHSAARASRLAAITQKNADVLTSQLARPVSYVPPLMAPRPSKRDRVEAGLVLITTNYTYPHNRTSMEWFLQEVWPLTGGKLRLEVTGLDDDRGSLRSLVESTSGARYLGFLPKPELEKAFARCAVVVNPTISGSGFQIKMLDALARGIPIVSTEYANPLRTLLPCSDNPQIFLHLLHKNGQVTASSSIDYNLFFRKVSLTWHDFVRDSLIE